MENISFCPWLSLKGILMLEHFLSACYGLGIDNLIVEIWGNEFPFFDGSSLKYLTLLQKAGIKRQNKAKDFLSLKNPLIEFQGDSFLAFLPGAKLEIRLFFSFPRLNFSSSFLLSNLNPKVYEREISWARTFGEYPFPSFLKRIGLSYEKKKGVFYSRKLRSPDEFARHKVLDLLGDLKILGRYLKGKIFAYNPYHHLTYRLLLRASEVENGKQ